MLNLVEVKNDEVVTSSLQVAEVFEKNHRHVLRDVDNLKQDVPNFGQMFHESNEPDSYSRNRRVYYMTRDGFALLAMGFTGKKALEFKLQYIDAFNRMEQTIKENQLAIPSNPMEALEMFFHVQKDTEKKVNEIEKKVVNLEKNKLITTEDKGTIDRMVRKKVALICKEQHLDQESKSLLFSDIGSSIKQVFEVPNRGRIKDKDFEKVVDFINMWEPSSVTKAKIRQMSLDLAE